MHIVATIRGVGIAGALVALAGCGPGRFSAEGYCETEARAICHFEYQCCTASERVDTFMNGFLLHHTESECVEEYVKAVCGSTATVVESVEQGRARWDEAEAEACYRPFIEALEACDATMAFTFAPGSDACKGYLSGTLADGATCFEDYECESRSSACATTIGDDPSAPLITSKGTCTPSPGEGEDCPLGKCAEGLFCNFVSSRCEPTRADNMPCNDSEQCLSRFCNGTTALCTSSEDATLEVDMCEGPAR
jgi:hypothetical protein